MREVFARLCETVRRAACFLVAASMGLGDGIDRVDLLAAAPPEATNAGCLFEAIEQGNVEVRVVARDANHLRVFIKNATQQPISVKLPDVLAARPVLAQQGFFNQGQGPIFGNNPNRNGQQASQAVAGPTNGTARANIFNIPPESVREFRVDTVCLEHGKPDPRSAVPYELAKLEDVCREPAVESLLVRYGQEELDREVVQAAAWNLANGMTWNELEKMSVPVAVNATKPQYSTQQLLLARRLSEAALKQTAAAEKAKPGLASSKATATPPAVAAPRDATPTKLRALETINARK
ncbi:MAG: hypothetical protein K8U03_12675 [Planctomycetia bacterium]|nr:hypothetical protein [Planctomycetia bacterium]